VGVGYGGAPGSGAGSGSTTHFAGASCPPWSISPRVGLALGPRSAPRAARLEASSRFFAGTGMDKPEGGFRPGAKLGAGSDGETVDWEPHGPPHPVGALSPWAGHPAQPAWPLGDLPGCIPTTARPCEPCLPQWPLKGARVLLGG